MCVVLRGYLFCWFANGNPKGKPSFWGSFGFLSEQVYKRLPGSTKEIEGNEGIALTNHPTSGFLISGTKAWVHYMQLIPHRCRTDHKLFIFVRGFIPTWVWVKIKPAGYLRFWCMFPLTRLPFGGYTVFDSHSHSHSHPQPL